MLRKKGKKENLTVFIEVLQNGEFLTETSRSLKKGGTIKISSSLKGDLALPFYPLPHDIEFMKLHRNGVEIFVDSMWEGFLVCRGIFTKIIPGKHDTRTYGMKKGDYGTLALNDLKVLIRVGTPRQRKVVALDKAYRGRFLTLWIGDQLNQKIMLLAFLCASFIFGGFVLGLYNRPDDRPKRLRDLNQEYILAFINPNHIRYLPEALQFNFNRAKPLVSAIDYYNSFTSYIMGFNLNKNRYIFPNSVSLYRKLYAVQDLRIKNSIITQSELENNVLSKGGSQIITVPTVIGESFSGSLLRLQDKIEIFHQSLERTLQYRRYTTKSFKNRDDGSYDFQNYRNFDNKGKKTPDSEILDQYNVFGRLTNEAIMYRGVLGLANNAAFQQYQVKKAREPKISLTKRNAAPIVIESDNEMLSFLPLRSFKDLNEKLQYINASMYGIKGPLKIREPLIGKINPRLIEKVIRAREFELQLCHELALRRNQALKGEMKWRWLLDSRGKILDLVLLSSTLKDRRMVRCVRKRILSWKFPRPRRGSVEVTHSFRFEPDKG